MAKEKKSAATDTGPRISVKKTARVPIASLQTYPGNARRGDVTAIAESLKAHGQYRALVVQRSTGYVLAGNHTFLALQSLGARVVLVDYLDVGDVAAKKIALVDNAASDNSTYDVPALSALLESLRAEGGGTLEGSGYDDASADELLERLRADAARPDPDADGNAGPARPDGPSLADRFLVPPFSVLDARQGYWQDRKRQWLALGIEAKVGSGTDAAPRPRPGGKSAEAAPEAFGEKYAGGDAWRGRKEDHEAFGSSAARQRSRKVSAAPGGSPSPDLAALASPQALRTGSTSGTSMADPVLLEIMLRWFCPPAGRVLDPFAGGTSGGCVASTLGYDFVGIEVRADQVAINDGIAKARGWSRAKYVCADSSTIDEHTPGGTFDLVLTDPPYFSLEVYSDQATDGSTKRSYAEFLEWYANILRRAASVLKADRFMVVKMGEARDKSGNYPNIVGDTARVLKEAGLYYYNSAILVTAVGSLPIRAGQVFVASRKLGCTHQHVQVFLKGDAKRAVAACGPVSIPDDLLAALEAEEVAGLAST